MTRVLSKAQVGRFIEMETTIDAVEDAFRLHGDELVPERIQLKQPHGETFVMPGVLGHTETMGVKVVTIYPGNDAHGIARSLGTILLHDNDTGELTAVMDGTHITNYRTGAIGAVAARHLAPSNSTTVGIIGSSTQARYQALALDTELDLETIRFYSRSAQNEAAVEALQSETEATLQAASSAAAACDRADIIVTATDSPTPVFPATAAQNAVLVIGVGSNDSSMREIPGEIIERGGRVYVDNYDQCLPVGDIADAIDEGRLSTADIVPFGTLLADDSPSSPSETVVVKSVGSIVFDIQTATRLLETASDADVGSDIDLQGTGR